MKTYTRACKQKKTKVQTEDVFFSEKAFKSPLELSAVGHDDDTNTPKTHKDKQVNTPAGGTPAGGKRKRKGSAFEQTEQKPKMKVEKKPLQVKKKANTNRSAGKNGKNASQSQVSKEISMEIAGLPSMNETAVEKVSSWLENHVEDVTLSRQTDSIELWREEGRSVQEREKSLFPEKFYKNLCTQYPTMKKPEVKKQIGVEIDAFLQSIKYTDTPVRKSGVRRLSTKPCDITDSEVLSYPDAHSSIELSEHPESTELETESLSILQSASQLSTPITSKEYETETCSKLQTATQSSTQSSTQFDTKSSTQSRSTFVKTRDLSDDVSQRRGLMSEKTPDKPTEFKFPKSRKTSAKGKKISFIDPKTSTRLFDGDTVNIEEAFRGITTILSTGVADKTGHLPEKTPDKPTEFKSPKSPKKPSAKGKTLHHLYPKTSTRLFDGDTINIEEAFPSVSTIKIEKPETKDENTDFLSPEKCKPPVKTSTPQDKHAAGRSLHFEMDISPVNQDSEDDSIGLHVDQSHEVNSEEIVALSPTESATEDVGPDQDNSSRRRKSSPQRKHASTVPCYSANSLPLPVSQTSPTNIRKKIKVSVKRTGELFDYKNIMKVPVCPLMTIKYPVRRTTHGRKRWHFIQPSTERITGSVPDDILCK